MAKHLTRIVPVEALPDPAGYEEGYPLLFGGTLYTLQEGVWVATGGGPGGGGGPASAAYEMKFAPWATTLSAQRFHWQISTWYTDHRDGGGVIELDSQDESFVRVNQDGIYTTTLMVEASGGGSFRLEAFFDWEDELFGGYHIINAPETGLGLARAIVSFTHALDAGEAIVYQARHESGASAMNIVEGQLFVNKVA